MNSTTRFLQMMTSHQFLYHNHQYIEHQCYRQHLRHQSICHEHVPHHLSIYHYHQCTPTNTASATSPPTTERSTTSTSSSFVMAGKPITGCVGTIVKTQRNVLTATVRALVQYSSPSVCTCTCMLYSYHTLYDAQKFDTPNTQ
jgi:hypothetical protein